MCLNELILFIYKNSSNMAPINGDVWPKALVIFIIFHLIFTCVTSCLLDYTREELLLVRQEAGGLNPPSEVSEFSDFCDRLLTESDRGSQANQFKRKGRKRGKRGGGYLLSPADAH